MNIFPAIIVEQVNGIGQTSYAIKYADGRIIHKGYRYYEYAEKMIDRLMALSNK